MNQDKQSTKRKCDVLPETPETPARKRMKTLIDNYKSCHETAKKQLNTLFGTDDSDNYNFSQVRGLFEYLDLLVNEVTLIKFEQKEGEEDKELTYFLDNLKSVGYFDYPYSKPFCDGNSSNDRAEERLLCETSFAGVIEIIVSIRVGCGGNAGGVGDVNQIDICANFSSSKILCELFDDWKESLLPFVMVYFEKHSGFRSKCMC